MMLDDEDDDDGEPSAAAEAFAEMGAGLHDALYPRDSGGISDREVLARRMRRGASVKLRERSSNRKLSPVKVLGREKNFTRMAAVRPFCSSTFAAIETTCPDSCAFKDNGCMADGGFTRIMSKRLNAAARGLTELQVIAEEAREIDRAFGGKRVPQDGARGGRDLRIHVGGDVKTEAAARLLAGAAARWRARGGGSVWTFTHSWRQVPREAWGCISALASVDNLDDVAAALWRGYAPAIVTREATCVECRLCLDRPLAAMGVGIAFAVHGRDKRAASAALHQIRRPSSPAPA